MLCFLSNVLYTVITSLHIFHQRYYSFISRNLNWTFFVSSLSLCNMLNLSFSFLNIGNIVIVTIEMSLSTNLITFTSLDEFQLSHFFFFHYDLYLLIFLQDIFGVIFQWMSDILKFMLLVAGYFCITIKYSWICCRTLLSYLKIVQSPDLCLFVCLFYIYPYLI